MPFVFSQVEYCDMHFVYGFCNGNARAAVEEYQRRFPDKHRKITWRLIQCGETKMCREFIKLSIMATH